MQGGHCASAPAPYGGTVRQLRHIDAASPTHPWPPMTHSSCW